jgi:hypothetical protein
MAGITSLFSGRPRQSHIVLASLKSPGVCRVRGANSPRDWDIRKGYGLTGATIVYTGDNLAKFSVDIQLWEDSQFLEWEIFAKILEKPKTRIAPALGIQHPMVNMAPWGITSVVVEDVDQFEDNDEGLFMATIHFIQFRKPLPMLARPVASIPAIATPNPTAADAFELELQGKLAQVAALGG